MKRRPARLRIVSWNVHVGNRRVRAGLLILVALFRPHVIALQEARRFRGTLPGYERFAADRSDREHATNCAVLVRRRGTRLAAGHPVFVPGDGWTYKGNRKPPRTFYGVTLRHGGLPWNVLNVHRCVGGPRGNSPDEWQREDEMITLWAAGVDGATAIVGDHNDRGESRRPGTVADLADRLDARILTPGRIDYAIVRDCGGNVRQLLRRLGSDHGPVLITLYARRTR